MPIRSVLLNVVDVERSVAFYSRFLGTRTVEQDADGAVLDAVSATIRLVRVAAPEGSTWVADDLQAGFRHVGFKVADLDARVAALHEAGVPFQLEPIHAEGDVRLTFFFDPDGTLLEMVEGPLRYHEVFDQEAVDADWALGEPDRPRLDHVAETVADLAATERWFAALGHRRMARIHQPNDPRGYEIDFLRDGDLSLEIFTYAAAPTTGREPQTSAPGFLAVELSGTAPAAASPVGTVAGRTLIADPDGLVHTVTA